MIEIGLLITENWPVILAAGSLILNGFLWIKNRISKEEFKAIANQIVAIRDDASDGGSETTFEEGLQFSVSLVEALSSKNKE